MRDGLVLGYVGLGATAAAIGPLLPPLTRQLDTTPAAVSLATTCLFTGLVLGAALAATAGRLPHGSVIAGGSVLQATGLLAVAVATSVPMVYGASAVLGVGFGAVEVRASVQAGSGDGGARRLALLTAVFAASAIATPAVVSVSLATTGSVLAATAVIAGVHVTAAAVTARTRSGPAAPDDDPPSGTTTRATEVTGVLQLTALLMAYVGAEATLATWSGELGRVLLDLTTTQASLVPTAFWVCLLLGRLATGVVPPHVPAATILTATLTVAAVAGGAATAVAAVSGAAALALAALCVVAMGPVYGVALSLGTLSHAATPRARTAWLVAVGAVGGALVPAVIAPLADGGPAWVLGGVTCLLLLAAASTRPGRRGRPRHPGTAAGHRPG